MAALGEELIGSDRPIVTVSGTPWVPGRASSDALGWQPTHPGLLEDLENLQR